ncbi:MAG: 2-C-methyl-D-erythritol 4-phosphate cytidylyltransferase [Ruminococcus sp.]|nr:2-C-methyl-D-erythritol 4-phosphate cytidylyltransferase [Ruminococcus sp.]
MSDIYTTAIIVAAGDSTRMGYKMSKQLIPLCGRPAIEYTLRAFQDCDMIDEIDIVTRPQDINDVAQIAFQFKKVMGIISGGADRAESVRKGIRNTSKRTTHFVIHDGARVMITPDEICRVLNTAIETGAATLGTPVIDTIKVAGEDGNIISTPDRSTLWAVQTPQVFEHDLYLRAIDNAVANGLSVTDDCAMVEALGVPVKIVRGEYTNIKLTTPSDIVIAEALLKRK